jgi:selenocysteine lyase/cysteine desulfurase
VAVSWVQFLSGYRIDLAELVDAAHSRGAFVAVDAIQGLGALQMDVGALGIDFLAAGAQKWLLGMQGAGFLYITEELQARVEPIRGWMNGPTDLDHLTEYDGELYPDARRYRITAPAMANVIAMDASMGMILEAGPAAIERDVLARARRLAAGLDGMGLARYGADQVNSGIVTVDHPEPDRARADLRRAGIHVAVRERRLRFSPHAYNTEAEIDAALDALAETVHV